MGLEGGPISSMSTKAGQFNPYRLLRLTQRDLCKRVSSDAVDGEGNGRLGGDVQTVMGVFGF